VLIRNNKSNKSLGNGSNANLLNLRSSNTNLKDSKEKEKDRDMSIKDRNTKTINMTMTMSDYSDMIQHIDKENLNNTLLNKLHHKHEGDENNKFCLIKRNTDPQDLD